MSDTIIKCDKWPAPIVGNIFLDGMLQPGVVEVNLTKGTITRGYRGEPEGEHQIKTDQGFVFDRNTQDFVLETVSGDIFLKWLDTEKARAWLAHNSQ